jgi:phenylalanyl-tRNA synthetase beta subunit
VVSALAWAVYGGEIDLLGTARRGGRARHVDQNRCRAYPSIVRDLSIFVGERLPAADLRGTIRSVCTTDARVGARFDRYDGKGVPDGQISLSIRLTFRDRDRAR